MDFLEIIWSLVLLAGLLGVGVLLIVSIVVIFYLMATGKRWD
jgi:hypothetical protein